MLLEEQHSPRSTLRTLHPPATLNGDPWQLVTTRQLAELLNVDPATISVWQYRGLGPRPGPRYFRGTVQTYRLDKVATWLAQRRGEAYDQAEAWKTAIGRWVMDPDDDIQKAVRGWVELLGPKQWQPEGCRWRVGGFQRYLDSLNGPWPRLRDSRFSSPFDQAISGCNQ